MSQQMNTTAHENTSLIIGHPYALVREGIARILKDGGFNIIKQVDTETELYRAVIELHPQIILVDIRIFPEGLDSVSKIKEKLLGTVVLFTVPDGKCESPDVLKAGAKGYLSVNQSPEQFIEALKLLAAGDVIISGDISESLQERIDVNIEPDVIANLTDREKNVATLIARGATNREIADKLMLSQHTVKIHLHNMLTKLDLKNRQQIAAYAIKQGLTEDIKTENYP